MVRRGYALGLDLGLTCTSAAIREHCGATRPIAVGRDGPAPSTLAVAPDGGLLVGDAAERHAITDPARVLRHVTLRAGDSVPVVLADRRLTGGEAVALLLTRLVETVGVGRGVPPDAIAVAHPAWWGPDELGPVYAALRGAATVPAPVAAVAAGGRSGGLVAVLDVDAGLTASVVRAAPRHGVLVGPPVAVPHPSDPAIVDPVFTHVRRMLCGTWPRLDPRDPAVRDAVAELRRRCTQAATTLSTRPVTDVEVDLPGLRTRLPLDRMAVAELLVPGADEVVEILDEALDAAGVDPAHLDEVVVTGAAARFPLVTEAIAVALGRPVVAAPLPAAAHGAAMLCRGAPWPAALPAAHPAESTANAEAQAQSDNGTPRPASSRATARHRPRPHRRARFVAAALTIGTTTVGTVAASAVALAPTAPADAPTPPAHEVAAHSPGRGPAEAHRMTVLLRG
jgi:molecular chaperone DnaK